MLDKLKEMLGFTNMDDDDDDDDDIVEEKKVQPAPVKVEQKPMQRVSNVVSFNSTPRERENGHREENARMVLVEPVRFEESQGIADSLLDHKGVVINIESCDTDIAAKIIDFVGGVIYAIDGTIQKVSQGIIVAAPQNIDIASELKHDMESTDEDIFAWITQYKGKGDF